MLYNATTAGNFRRVKGKGAAGFAVGLMHIDAAFPVIPGNPVNATTFDFPVLYQSVQALSGEEVVSGHPNAEQKLIDAARTLEEAGVGAIVGICGSFGNFTSALKRSVNVPVIASVLTQVPSVLSVLPEHKKLGIVFADKRSFTDRIIEECKIGDPSRIRTIDCRDDAQFDGLIRGADVFDQVEFERFFRKQIEEFLSTYHDIGAIMLQCNELIPFSWVIHELADIPVFHVAGLIRSVHASLTQPPPTGFVYGIQAE